MRSVAALVLALTLVPVHAVAEGTPKNDILFELDGLWSMQADGSKGKRLTDGTFLEGEASWAPDGRRVVVSRYRTSTRNWDLYVLDGSGSVLRRLTRTAASERNPAWSPNGRWIAFDKGVKGIFRVRPSGGQATRLSKKGVLDVLPAWSPNSSRLVFLSDRRGSGDFDLYVARSDLSGARRIRDLGGEVVRIDWGSAGWIALDYYPRGRRVGVFILRPSGRRFHRVGRRDDTQPVWSPNGRRLLVFHQPQSGFGIWRMNRDGSDRVLLRDEGVALDWVAR